MAQYLNSDEIEENGIKILWNSLETKFFLVQDWARIGGKNNYPDIDGQIRLRDGNTNYLNLYLHYQLKSKQKINNLKKCLIDRKIINYLSTTNVPTILFIVETKTKRVFWFFLDNQVKKSFNLSADNKGRHINLLEKEINGNFLELNQIWQKFAKMDSYEEKITKLDIIVNNFQQNIKSCLGIIYLFNTVSKQKLPQIFSQLLNIKEPEALTIIEKLLEEEIISSTTNYYLLENEQLGIETLYELFDNNLLDFHNLAHFLNINNHKTILKQLNTIQNPKVDEYFKNLINEFHDHLPKFSNNDDIYNKLELIEQFYNRVPDKTISILKSIINKKTPLATQPNALDTGEIHINKSHNDLIEKALELLKSLRYIRPKEVFDISLKLSISDNKKINDKANKVLEEMAKYNLFVLQQIGYEPQKFLLDNVEKFNVRKTEQYFDPIISILKVIAMPYFEGITSNYEGLTIHSGGLPAKEPVKQIRKQTLLILQKLYQTTPLLPHKKKILKIFMVASQTPPNNYTKELEQLILDDTNDIIKFYIEIIPNIEPELLRIIEEQVNWFTRRFDNRLENIEKLQSLIAQNDEYQIFKTFVGFDDIISDTLTWEERAKKREAKIQDIVNQISEKNYKDWKAKILSIINSYNQSEETSQYQYFNIFLYEFGRQKPQLAKEFFVANEKVLSPFIIYLVSGIWQSESKVIAYELIENWIKNNKYLPICALIFSYVKEIDEKLFLQIFNKAKQNNDLITLNKVIIPIVSLYPDISKNTKLLFIKAIQELTKHGNSQWVNYVWYQKTILENCNEKEFDIILKNLTLVHNIDHHIEELLMPIAKQYPAKIIEFFKRRVSIYTKLDNKKNYDAIPFELYQINSILQNYEILFIDELFKWLNMKNWVWKWEGGELLKLIFPTINQTLDDKLIELLKDSKTKLVLRILNTYSGKVSLDNKICIKLIEESPQYHNDLIKILSAINGVVSGEYGFVDSYKNKQETLKKWEHYTKKSMKAFVTKYEKYLINQIEYEQKRADERIALSKQQYK